jgi:hypothetical protein
VSAGRHCSRRINEFALIDNRVALDLDHFSRASLLDLDAAGACSRTQSAEQRRRGPGLGACLSSRPRRRWCLLEDAERRAAPVGPAAVLAVSLRGAAAAQCGAARAGRAARARRRADAGEARGTSALAAHAALATRDRGVRLASGRQRGNHALAKGRRTTSKKRGRGTRRWHGASSVELGLARRLQEADV